MLDAAIPSHIVKGEPTELQVLIRLPESVGLKGVLLEDDEAEAKPEDVRSTKFGVMVWSKPQIPVARNMEKADCANCWPPSRKRAPTKFAKRFWPRSLHSPAPAGLQDDLTIVVAQFVSTDY